MKITFMGAGSTVFCKNVLGDILLTPEISRCDIALYDIDKNRLEESYAIVDNINRFYNGGKATIKTYLGENNRKAALKNADFVINAIQVGFYKPCTVIDFEIPKKYGLRQTIGDTLGIGGIFRGLRTIKVLKEFADDMSEVCPDALFINYTNPMAILTGYMNRYTPIKTIGLCHSVQVCVEALLNACEIKDAEVGSSLIAGINHMAWLLEIKDKNGADLYPLIRTKAKERNRTKHYDMVRLDYIDKLGYYCTESSEHNAEYNPYYIKPGRPDLIEKFNIPLDEYPRRCINQIEGWEKQKQDIMKGGKVEHKLSREYCANIINAVTNDKIFKFGGNVINNGLIENLPKEACVEVPCYADSAGIHPTYIGKLPLHLAALNMTNINMQLLTIEAAVSGKTEDLYHAAMLDPLTAATLSTDEIVSMCDEMKAAHEAAGFKIL